MDCVPKFLENIDRNVYDSVICGFVNDAATPSYSFDVIVAGEILEHIPGIAVYPSLCEALRLLRLKGKLMLTTPNPHYLKNRLRHLGVLIDQSHDSQHTIASMCRRLEDAGFSKIRILGSRRMTRYVGQHFPWLTVYGSYLAIATK
jgi:2-polyprenyl-3-methyl-5-hydroxy-6-metoxy-1,4-benzoquinol methylase